MEGEGQDVAVSADSSTAAAVAPDPTAQAPTQPVQGAPQEQQVPFHQHPRFQQLIRDGQMSKQTIAQLTEQLQAAQAQLGDLQKKQNAGQSTPEEDEELRKAAGALERIFMRNPEVLERVLASHPKFKALADNSDKLLATTNTTQQIQQAQQQSMLKQASSHIHTLAKEAGLPQDPAYLQRLVRLVAAEAQQLEGGNQRFAQGDFAVLDEAFKALQGNFLAHTQRAGTAALLQTKSRTQSLPPAPRGGAAGPAGLSKFDPSKPNAVRDRFAELARAGSQMLAEGSKE